MNSTWGAPGPNSYAYLEFFGSGGAYFRKDLVGNIDIRDYGHPGFTDTINGTTTINVYRQPIPGQPTGYWTLDKQEIDLPDAFHTQTLDRIRVVDNGANYSEGLSYAQRVFLYGVTVQALTLPDLAATSLAWDTAQGGVDFGY
jgi:hypothetical protein